MLKVHLPIFVLILADFFAGSAFDVSPFGYMIAGVLTAAAWLFFGPRS